MRDVKQDLGHKTPIFRLGKKLRKDLGKEDIFSIQKLEEEMIREMFK